MLKPPCFLCFLELPWIGSLQNFQRKSEMGTPPHQLKADSGTLQLLDSFCLHHFLVLAPHNLSQVMHEHCKQYFIVPNFTVWLSFVSVKFQHECDELYSVSRHHHHFPNYFLLPTLIVPLLAFSFLRPASQIPLQQTECTVLIQSIRHTLWPVTDATKFWFRRVAGEGVTAGNFRQAAGKFACFSVKKNYGTKSCYKLRETQKE